MFGSDAEGSGADAGGGGSSGPARPFNRDLSRGIGLTNAIRGSSAVLRQMSFDPSEAPMTDPNKVRHRSTYCVWSVFSFKTVVRLTQALFFNIFVKTQLDEKSQNSTQFLSQTPTILRKTQFSGKNNEFLLHKSF